MILYGKDVKLLHVEGQEEAFFLRDAAARVERNTNV